MDEEEVYALLDVIAAKNETIQAKEEIIKAKNEVIAAKDAQLQVINEQFAELKKESEADARHAAWVAAARR